MWSPGAMRGGDGWFRIGLKKFCAVKELFYLVIIVSKTPEVYVQNGNTYYI